MYLVAGICCSTGNKVSFYTQNFTTFFTDSSPQSLSRKEDPGCHRLTDNKGSFIKVWNLIGPWFVSGIYLVLGFWLIFKLMSVSCQHPRGMFENITLFPIKRTTKSDIKKREKCFTIVVATLQFLVASTSGISLSDF